MRSICPKCCEQRCPRYWDCMTRLSYPTRTEAECKECGKETIIVLCTVNVRLKSRNE